MAFGQPSPRAAAFWIKGAVTCLASACLAVSNATAADPPEGEHTVAAAAIHDPAEPAFRGGRAALPTPQELEKMQAAIGSVVIDVDEIFDEGDPRENNFLYRLANDLHLRTRDGTVREQLLFRSGEPFSAQKAAETARLLRERGYLSEAEVEPTRYDPDTNTVDMKVRVRDVWTLEPGIGFGRSGGANKTRIRIAEENLFGMGQKVAIGYKSDEDRSGLGVQFQDPNLFQSWWGFQGSYADTSDGSSSGITVGRPFFSLSTPWSFLALGQATDQITPLYDLGEKVNEFDSRYTNVGIEGGTSNGIVDGWTKRWLAGYRYERARFDFTSDGDTPSVAIPEDRLLSYPWIGFEWIEDRYRTAHNQNQIGRVEDVFLGRKLRATLGWATPALGSDRSAGIFSLSGEMGMPIGERDTLFVDSAWSGRIESGATADAVLQAGAQYLHRFNEKNLFVASVDAAHATALDLDHQLQLGGDNGLRGYPLRYQTGTSRALISLEERYFTDWHPFRLFRVGGAAFADVGQVWGSAPFASESQGTLADVGIGLRIGNARSGLGNVLHIDLAFPIAASQDIDSVQLLLHAQHSF